METVAEKGAALAALAPVKRERQKAPHYAAGVRRAVAGMAPENVGGGIAVTRMADGWAVCDHYAVRLWAAGTQEGNDLAALLRDLGADGAAVVRVLRSGPVVARLVNAVGPTVAMVEKVLGAQSGEVAAVSVERVAAADASQYPDGLVRVVLPSGHGEHLLDGVKVAPFADAAQVVACSTFAPVRFYAADGSLLGVLMPLRGVAVAS